MSDHNGKATLYRKLAKVMSGINRVPKNGYNDHYRYPFVQDNDVLDAVRNLMSEHELSILVNMVGVPAQTEMQTKNGTTIHTVATFEFTIACGETGETVTTQWTGEASDAMDKGINKAATSAMKYWLLKTFMISTGDDADNGPEPSNRRPVRRAAAPAPRQQPRAEEPAPPPQPAHWATNGGGQRVAAKMAELGITWAAVADKMQPDTILARMSDTTLTEAEFTQRLIDLAAVLNAPAEPKKPVYGAGSGGASH